MGRDPGADFEVGQKVGDRADSRSKDGCSLAVFGTDSSNGMDGSLLTVPIDIHPRHSVGDQSTGADSHNAGHVPLLVAHHATTIKDDIHPPLLGADSLTRDGGSLRAVGAHNAAEVHRLCVMDAGGHCGTDTWSDQGEQAAEVSGTAMHRRDDLLRVGTHTTLDDPAAVNERGRQVGRLSTHNLPGEGEVTATSAASSNRDDQSFSNEEWPETSSVGEEAGGKLLHFSTPPGLVPPAAAGDEQDCLLVSILKQECRFMRLRGWAVLFPDPQVATKQPPYVCLRVFVEGLPWVRRAKWLQPLRRAVAGLLHGAGHAAVIQGGNLFAPLDLDCLRVARVEFAAARVPEQASTWGQHLVQVRPRCVRL